MSSSRKLSTDEVDALMEGLQSGVISTEGNISPEAEVRPFVFGSDDLSLLGDYYALRLINERFARLARSTFYQCLEYNLGLVLFLLKLKRLMNIAAVLTAL